MPAGLRARDERGGPGAAPRPPLLPFLMAASTPFGRWVADCPAVVSEDLALGLVRQIAELRAEMCRLESAFAGDIEGVHPGRRESARNLIHYVTLRRHDLRSLQDALVPLGLSSLGRAESHVLANVNAVLGLLSRLAGAPAAPRVNH